MQLGWPTGRISEGLSQGFFYVGPSFSDAGAVTFGAIQMAVHRIQMQNIVYPARVFPKSDEDLDESQLQLRHRVVCNHSG